MRLVKLTVIYDMDDEGKSLEAELKDWLEGNVSVLDMDCTMTDTGVGFDGEVCTITLKEV